MSTRFIRTRFIRTKFIHYSAPRTTMNAADKMAAAFTAACLLICVGCGDSSLQQLEEAGATLQRNRQGDLVGVDLADARVTDQHLALLA